MLRAGEKRSEGRSPVSIDKRNEGNLKVQRRDFQTLEPLEPGNPSIG